jgi:PiT family inorganic phosphate transporter
MHLFDTPIGTGQLVLLIVALLIACGFEFVNGFHDTANAVATVIYTRSLRPWTAVVLSGTLNLLGVYLGGIAVAMSIIKLLPVELLAASGAGAGLAMVLSLLVAAILWNLGTWWLGLPASSSHTLIGAIVGVGLANSLMPGHVFGSGVNWHKVQEIGMSLLVSPIFGLGAAALLLFLARNWLLKSPLLHQPADPDKRPPLWIRAILTTTCGGVSLAHGSNDGQKGVGLVMLILIGLLPADFALNASLSKAQLSDTVAIAERLETNTRDAFGAESGKLASNVDVAAPKTPAGDVLADLAEIRAALNHRDSVRDIPADARFGVRTRIMHVDTQLAALEKTKSLPPAQLAALQKDRSALRASIDYAPGWVIGLIALSLGVGTMIGWKRIVVTVGEKIGKTHLTYAQGASAEIVAMTTIDDRPVGLVRPAGEHDARSLVGDRRDDARAEVGAAEVDHPQHRARLGADAAGGDAPGGRPVPALPRDDPRRARGDDDADGALRPLLRGGRGRPHLGAAAAHARVEHDRG